MFGLRRSHVLMAAVVACSLVFIGVQSHPILEGRVLQHANEKQVKVKGKTYELTPLSKQGGRSAVYKVDGYENDKSKPALIKIVYTTTDAEAKNMEHEIKVLKKGTIKQLWTSTDESVKDDKGKSVKGHKKFILVLKDIHKGYPTASSPDLASLDEWAEKDKQLDLNEAVSKVRKLAIKKAEDMADDVKIVYRDMQPKNIFTDKDQKVVYFIDYGFPNVINIDTGLFSGTGSSGQMQIRKANGLKQMKENAENHFTVAEVKKAVAEDAKADNGEESSKQGEQRGGEGGKDGQEGDKKEGDGTKKGGDDDADKKD